MKYIHNRTFLLRHFHSTTYQMIEIGLTRWPVFLMGCMLGRAVYERKSIPRICGPVSAVCFIVVLVILNLRVLHNIYIRYFYAFGGLSALFLFTWMLDLIHWEPLHRFLSFFGKLSIHLYLSHMLLQRLYHYTSFNVTPRLRYWFCIILLSIPPSLLVRNIENRIRSLILK